MHLLTPGKEWLDACYAWIVSELRLDPSTQMPQIIDNVEHQLLSSHLSDSMIQGTGLPANVAGTNDTTTRLRGPPVLVEILSIMEIGHSAFTLNNTRQARIDKADLTGLGAEGAGDGEEKIPKYPRSMLHFELSDGSLTFEAMEYRSIPQIQLGVTELGYKVRAAAGALFRVKCACDASYSSALLVDALERRVFSQRGRVLGTENDCAERISNR